MVTNVTKEWLLGESGTDGANANVGITGVGSGAPKYHSLASATTFPTGMIIQAAHGSVTGDVYSATTSWTSSPLKAASNITFTPKFATSNILLIANFQAYTAATYGYYDFYKNASDVAETYNLSGLVFGLTMIDVATSWEGKMMTFLDPVAENSTTEKTYSISARGHTASNTYIGYSSVNSNQLITIMEIAG